VPRPEAIMSFRAAYALTARSAARHACSASASQITPKSNMGENNED